MTKRPTMHSTLLLLFLVLVQGTAVAQQVTRVVDDGVVYESVSGRWAITGIEPSNPSFPTDGIITLKSSIMVDVFDDGNLYPRAVRTIQGSAFDGQGAIHGVVIQEGIQTIGDDAFNNCPNITSLQLPSTITKVGLNAFGRSTNLRWVDCRQVASGWHDNLLAVEVKTPYHLGASDYTLMYMPSWCDKNEYAYTNAVHTDADSGDRTCSTFRLSRNLDYCVPYDFTADEVQAEPVLRKDDGAYSVCLPYDQPVPQNAKAYLLQGRETEDGVLYAVFGLASGNMLAGTPYLILASEEDAHLVCDQPRQIPTTAQAEPLLTTVTAAGITIHGTFKRINFNEAAEKYYVLQAANVWKKVGGSYTSVGVPPFRAYLTMNDAQAASFAIQFADDTDGLPKQVERTSLNTASDDGWMTLQGQWLHAAPAAPGIYIHHGRKIVVK